MIFAKSISFFEDVVSSYKKRILCVLVLLLLRFNNMV